MKIILLIIFFTSFGILSFSQTLLSGIEFGMNTEKANEILNANKDQYLISINTITFDKPKAFDKEKVKWVEFQNQTSVWKNIFKDQAINNLESIKSYFITKNYHLDNEFHLKEIHSQYIGVSGTCLTFSNDSILIGIKYVGTPSQQGIKLETSYLFWLIVTSKKIDDITFKKLFDIPSKKEMKNNAL